MHCRTWGQDATSFVGTRKTIEIGVVAFYRSVQARMLWKRGRVFPFLESMFYFLELMSALEQTCLLLCSVESVSLLNNLWELCPVMRHTLRTLLSRPCLGWLAVCSEAPCIPPHERRLLCGQ